MRRQGADLPVLLSPGVVAVIGGGVAPPELVERSGLTYGISASGKRTTLHAANFRPADIAPNVPLLASR
jgi:hypothetical protein